MTLIQIVPQARPTIKYWWIIMSIITTISTSITISPISIVIQIIIMLRKVSNPIDYVVCLYQNWWKCSFILLFNDFFLLLLLGTVPRMSNTLNIFIYFTSFVIKNIVIILQPTWYPWYTENKWLIIITKCFFSSSTVSTSNMGNNHLGNSTAILREDLCLSDSGSDSDYWI